MNNYTPIFENIVDSSLWEEPYYVRVLFLSMLALKDRDHVVRADVYRLKKRANMKEEEVIEGLKRLEAPDRKRPGQLFEGRRIEKVEDGYLILNGDKYQKLMREANRRAANAKAQAAFRARQAALAGKPKMVKTSGERLAESQEPPLD